MPTPRATVPLLPLLLLLALPLAGAGALEAEDDARGTLRVALPARPGPHAVLTPLVYWGGFQTKSAVYEPLVRVGEGGRLGPGLAERWDVSPDGRVVTLHLRPGVTAHDGRPFRAEDVRDHLVRWRGNPGNRWLGSTERLEAVEATGPATVRVTLSEPWCFLEECAIVNPAFVVAGGAYDAEGTLTASVGTGPYRVAEADAQQGLTLVAHEAWWAGRPGLARIEVERLTPEQLRSGEALERVRRGELDLLADGESPLVPREELADLAADPRLRVWTGPGSGTTLLVLNRASGPLADRELRRRVAAALDREAWVSEVERGYADPATTLFRAGWAGWPTEGRPAAPAASPPGGAAPVPALRLLLAEPVDARTQRQADVLGRQLGAAGLSLHVQRVADREAREARLRAGDFDLALRTTHGAPYDPFVMLQVLFLPRPEGRTASSSPPVVDDAVLAGLVRRALSARGEAERTAAFAAVQQRLDEELPLVPLYVHRRVAVSAAAVTGLAVGADAFDLGFGRAAAPARTPTALIGRGPPRAAVLPPAPPAAEPAVPAAAAPPTDPREGDVPLPAGEGWNASLVLDNGTVGVWHVRALDVFPTLGCPDVVGLDDKGRLHLLTSYSGRWTPMTRLEDGRWLGGVELLDLDPRLPGAELYTGGDKGNLYQLVARGAGIVDTRLVGETPGQAINLVVGGELDPERPGPELLLFAWPDGLWQATPSESPTGFTVAPLDRNGVRVRDALRLPGADGLAPELITASRNGLLHALRVVGGKPVWTVLHAEAMGLGRVALRPRATPGEALVLYSTLDDGRVLRHERAPGPGGASEGRWTTDTIYLGPQGPRGLAAGRFDADPAVETLAVFGYGREVELLRRAPGAAWSRETVFRDRDKGHWLAVAELDGRNGTDELLASGYGGRIVLLSRPPGYGRPGLVGASR